MDGPLNSLRLGVNIDHVATLRNARGSPYPNPVRAARLAREAGADVITMHLREDRRHIRDEDVSGLSEVADIPLKLEMAATREMVDIALGVRPHACCIVPERREELTTEGGLDAVGLHNQLAPFVGSLLDAGIRVSLFIAPEENQIGAALRLRAPVVELHTGAYCEAVLVGDELAAERRLKELKKGAEFAHRLGLEVHAGHGLTFDNVASIAAIAEITELQIGHFLVGEAIFTGFAPAIMRMRDIMDRARASA
nr:MAG: pyridoxine 5'-phosphate synthase [Hyphomicrobiales bacterium]